jgi:hypothetical protein
MAVQAPPPGIRLVTLAAMAGLAWALIALAYASLAPPTLVPRLFHNYHAEHLAAFYAVALLSAVALPSVRLMRIGQVLLGLAIAFALFRVLALVNKVFYVEDLACDIAGVLAALVPMAVGRLRQFNDH